MSESELSVGDKVCTVNMPGEFERELGHEPTEVVGEVVDIVEESVPLSDNTVERAVIEGKDGEEKRVGTSHLDSEVDGSEGGVTIQILEPADADESDADADSDDEPELVTDGGRDINDHVDDETIATVIKQHDDVDHPDALTVGEVRDLLAHVQRGAEAGWDTWMDHVEGGDAEVVAEDQDTIVLDTGAHDSVAEELGLSYDGPVELDEAALSVVTQLHHELADGRCDRNWSASYPYVMCKPGGFDAGQRYVEAVVNNLQQRGLGPGQAWSYYGVEIRGNSMKSWGSRKGDYDHKNVSDALQKAKQKLP